MSPGRPQSVSNQREQAGHLTPTLRGARLTGNGHGSPRTQLPSFNNLSSSVVPEDDEGMAKRRRVEAGDGSRGQTRESYQSPQEYEEDDERQFRREMAARQAGSRSRKSGHGYSPKRDVEHFEASSMGALRQSDGEMSQSGPTAEELYDSSLPLSRRRGDVAHAKASRLHIDTGSVEPGSAGAAGPGSGFDSATRSKPSSSMSMHGIAKSAPPHKMTFADRDGAPPFDPRGEPPPSLAQSRNYANGPLPLHQPYYPAVYSRKDGGATSQESHNFNDASPSQTRRSEYAPPSSHLAMQQHPRQALPSAGTPLSAIRPNAFVPQTATLPSPAYHTTHFMRNPMGAGSSSAQGLDSRSGPIAPPKTAGFNPPPTARLPEHLRSPPSSKTQFLSLFANFYDSLTDSRTLKHTLEDQVRRSNTLLQTLQKSSRVLELTVDRRVREERTLWEAKVHALEQRCLRLEKHLGTALGEEVQPTQSASPLARISPEAQMEATTKAQGSPSEAEEATTEVQMDEQEA